MKWIINKDWKYLSQQYDWVADMHDVPQSPVHHEEGDVAIHTQMVLQALINSSEYPKLPDEAQEILWMSALLHDVEKRSTTFTETDGNIVSPGHAKKGALTSRHILFTEFDLPFKVREQIVNLVRYHGLPLWIMEKPDPLKALLEASFQVNSHWLTLLAKADVLGRICRDQAKLLDCVDFFAAYCQEQECYGKGKYLPSNLSRFHYFHSDAVTPDYLPFEDTVCEVVLLSGLPGMGKDHYIRQHFADLPVISLDTIRKQHKLKPEDKSANGWVAQQAKEQARFYLRARQGFVWNATNITSQMRSQLIALFTAYKASVRLIYIEQPYKKWQEQNMNREEQVSQVVLQKLLQKLEVPKISEAHIVEHIAY